jgi:hypothetical protein
VKRVARKEVKNELKRKQVKRRQKEITDPRVTER